MMLAFDVGNTNIVMAVFDGQKLSRQWRFHTDEKKTADEYEALVRSMLSASDLTPEQLDGAIISSVVPRLSFVLSQMARKLIDKEPIRVNPTLNLGIHMDVDSPEKVGQDRIVNAVAAYHRFQNSVIIVDFGTATTLDVVSSEGVFQGGIICPGMEIIAEALVSKTSQLFRVDLEPPKQLVGKNTTDSIKAGLFYGYTGMIESLITQLMQEVQNPETLIIATGGLSNVVSKAIPSIHHWISDLTLEGLQLIYKMNQS